MRTPDKVSNPELPDAARRVQEWLTARGYKIQVLELPDSTRTAREAAETIGCTIGQIVKSLVFRGRNSQQPALILASGKNRIDEEKVATILGEPVQIANADFVRRTTGFSIGGVPPVGHSRPLVPIIDRDLFDFGEIWAAAGTPFSVFCLTPELLQEMTKGIVGEVA